MKKIKAWTVAIRIHTLGASVGPIVLGLACAFHYQNTIDLRLALITVLCTLCMQIAANMINDYYDFTKGVDGEQNIGFAKVANMGVISPKQIRNASIFILLLALLMGVALIIEAGWPIAIIGVLAIFFAYAYTGGPYPLSYHALGEVAAFIFFGPIAVWGTFFIQTKTFNLFPLIIGCGPGYIAAALMAVNNLRDIENDKAHGKVTIASKYGSVVGRGLCLILIGLSSLVPIIAYSLTKNAILALATFSPYLFHRTWVRIAKNPIDELFNHSLLRTGQYLLLYCVLFALGLII